MSNKKKKKMLIFIANSNNNYITDFECYWKIRIINKVIWGSSAECGSQMLNLNWSDTLYQAAIHS